jgi:ABC-type Co2+ transport system permease subunit
VAASTAPWSLSVAVAVGNVTGLAGAAQWGRVVTGQDVIGVAIIEAAVGVLVWGGVQVRRRHCAAVRARPERVSRPRGERT